MNSRLSLEFGQTYVRIPLRKSPHILPGDALEANWQELLPADKCSYILGNPPFIGAKFQSDEQRAQVRQIADLGKTGGTLDFVTAWFIKAGEYAKGGKCSIGFVSTNSICQGEQVAQLWPILFDRCKLEIAFAHRTFAWGSDARGKAHVHVVIIGLSKANAAPKVRRLFSYIDINGDPQESQHGAISPYLFDATNLANPHVVVKEVSKPVNGLRQLVTGTQPLEDGNLTFSNEEMVAFLKAEPAAVDLFRLFPGAREFIRGEDRWILHTQNLSPTELKTLPLVQDRLKKVREFRGKSSRSVTKRLADFPSQYGVTVLPTSPFLIIPQVSSERRNYVPIAWMTPPTIPSEKLRALLSATLEEFALLTSNMHMAWMRTVTGRMKSDYMYSVGVVYNTFPMPQASDAQLTKLEPLAQAILDARASHTGSTLADLYDPDLMPANLRKAHNALDKAVDKLYRKSGFSSDSERVEHLLGMYEKMVAPLTAAAKKTRKTREKKSHD